MQIHNSSDGSGPAEAENAEIRFRRAGDPQPLLLVPVRVNGTGPYEFILDTGAGTSLLSPSLAASLGIPSRGSKKAFGAAGEIAVELGTVAELSLGPASVRDLPVAITPEIDRIGKIVGAEISGDVGYDVLKDYRLTVNYRRSRLRLERGEAGKRNVPIAPEEAPFRLAHGERPLLLVPAVVNGTGPHAFVLDTGASMTMLAPALARELGVVGGAPVAAAGAGGRIAALAGRVRSFAIGRAAAFELDVAVSPFLAPLGDAVGTRLDGIVGYNFLRAFRLAIDYPRGVVRFDPAPAEASGVR